MTNGSPDRTCAGGSACCELVPVQQGLNKPAFTLCRHQRVPPSMATGCAIYADRPRSCRVWSCGWLINESFPEELRPDRCGVVVDQEIDLIAVNGEEMPAAQLLVARGHEEDHKHVELIRMLIMSLLDDGLAVLWRLPFAPGETSMAVAMFLTPEGTIAVSAPHSCTPGALGGTVERMFRANALADQPKGSEPLIPHRKERGNAI